ncbi:g4247 [Coccomyxa viridis]|uniref:G4247 protein n=1 Tax=Coccomyxa viridis TaxID=1274662 RepID=A0ABP1FPT7_9CHLO
MLMRFGDEIGDGKNLVEHCGHCLRYELIKQWKANPFAEEIMTVMARSVFCAAAPGQTQDSVHCSWTIVKRCIPVTFYRGNNRPCERHLNLPLGRLQRQHAAGRLQSAR